MSGIRTSAGSLLLSIPLALVACASGPKSPGPAHEIRGQGQPIVVLASGYGMSRNTWQAVGDELAKDFTVFSFDRPGYGDQPDTDRPRDPCTIATDTREALRSAGLKPPYVLVGHSLGGLHQYVYARLYPQDVAGFVLLDPTHPRHWAMLQAERPLLATALQGMVKMQRSQALRNEFGQQTDCLKGLDQRQALHAPSRLLVSRRYKDMEKDLAPTLQALQNDWKTLTSVAAIDPLWDSGHHIQTERPDAVAQAVREVAGHPRPSSGHPSRVQIGKGADFEVQIGATRQPEVAQRLGRPDETHQDDERTVWVYQAPGIRVPMAISLIPVIGDLADLVELGQSAVDRHEAIIEFDAQGVVRHARRRPVEP